MKSTQKFVAMFGLLAILLSVGCDKPGSSNPLAPSGSNTLNFKVFGVNADGKLSALTNGVAYINVNGNVAFTDDKGVATLSGLPDGAVTVSVGANNWYTASTYSVDVTGSKPVDNSSVPLKMKDDLIYQSVSTVTGQIQPNATLVAPANIHFRVQVSSWVVAPTVGMTFKRNGVSYNLGGIHSGIVVSDADYGTKVYDIWAENYKPCFYRSPTDRTLVCTEQTDTFEFYLSSVQNGSVEKTVLVNFMINWNLASVLR